MHEHFLSVAISAINVGEVGTVGVRTVVRRLDGGVGADVDLSEDGVNGNLVVVPVIVRNRLNAGIEEALVVWFNFKSLRVDAEVKSISGISESE